MDSSLVGCSLAECSFAILAGGRARRMRAVAVSTSDASADIATASSLDKCLLRVGGKTILEHIVARLGCNGFATRALNANGALERFGRFSREHDFALVSDAEPTTFLGPLAGLLASMRWARECGSSWLLTVPGDCPFLPVDLFARLCARQAKTGALITCAASGARVVSAPAREGAEGELAAREFRSHPIIALWSTSLASDLAESLLEYGVRKIDRWTSKHSPVQEHWQEHWQEHCIGSPDPFFNINSVEDLARANTLAQGMS